MNETGFEYVFNQSAAQVEKAEDVERLYKSFRKPGGPFDFTHCGSFNQPDLEALGKAALIDCRLLSRYLSAPKLFFGYDDAMEWYLPVDIVDSRHAMMSTFVFNYFKNIVGNVVELGGGFGNWARMNHYARSCNAIDFQTWTIIDLPHVSKLQRWYLDRLGVLGVDFVTTDEVHGWLNHRVEPINLIIASHSLSELSAQNFIYYLDNLLPRTSYLFYATHLSYPTPILVDSKLKLLGEHFDVVAELYSEGDKVLNRIYKKRP